MAAAEELGSLVGVTLASQDPSIPRSGIYRLLWARRGLPRAG